MPPVSLRSILPIAPRTWSEAEKLEPILVDSLSSPLSLERRRMEARVLSVAKEEAETMVNVLLRHHDAKSPKARESIERLLLEISKEREGRAAVLENLSHPDQNVRKGLRVLMERLYGPAGSQFAADFEQSVFLTDLALSRDIFIEDIEMLAELSKVTLLEGEVDRAVKDIALVVDLLKHRYRSVETMKNYLAQMLRVTPELSRLGVPTGRVEESLKNAMKANKHRSFDYTQELIDERMVEVAIIDQLRALGAMVHDQVRELPRIGPEDMNAMDVWVFARLKELVRTGSSLAVTGREVEFKRLLASFLGDEIFPYLRDRAQDRLDRRDPSLLFIIHTVGLACLKLMNDVMPNAAEDIFSTFYSDLEGATDLGSVPWPSMVL